MVDLWDAMEGMADMMMGLVNPVARSASKPIVIAVIVGLIIMVFAVFILLPGVRFLLTSLIKVLYGG